MDNMKTCIIVRGLFERNEDKKLICTEYTGIKTLLTDEPKFMINSDEADLGQFLISNIPNITTIGISFVRCDNLEDLFSEDTIIEEKTQSHTSVDIIDVLRHIDGRPYIGKKSLYDILWRGINRDIDKQFIYMEIYEFG